MNYSKEYVNHIQNPRNMGEINNADVVYTSDRSIDGDYVKLYIKIDAENRIVDKKFQTFGCANAIARTFIVMEMAKNKSLDDALLISYNDIKPFLKGLPDYKLHCTDLGLKTLKQASKKIKTQKN